MNLALAANAKLVVTRDRDLLDVPKALLPETQWLMRLHPDFTVLTPDQLLASMQ